MNVHACSWPRAARWVAWAVVLWSCVLGLRAMAAPSEDVAAMAAAVARGWEYRWGPSPRDAAGQLQWTATHAGEPGWVPLGALSAPPGRHGQQELWLRWRLPSVHWSEQYLFLHEVQHAFTVHVGGQATLQAGSLTAEPFRSAGWRWFMVPLEPRHAGQYLVLHVRSDDVADIGPLGTVAVGSGEQLLTDMVRRDLERVVVAALSMFVGLLSLFIYWRKRDPREYAYFALFALVAGLYVLCRTEVKQLVLDAPVGWMRLEIGCVSLMPPLLMLHLRGILHARFRRLLTGLGAVGMVLVGLTAALELSGVFPVYNSLFVILFELLLTSVLTIGMAIWSIRDGLVESRIIMVGLFAAGVVSSLSTLSSLHLVPFERHTAHFAILLLILCLGAIMIRRFMLTYFDVERTLRDREARLSAILQALPDSYVLASAEGAVLDSQVRPEDAPQLLAEGTIGATLAATLPDAVAGSLDAAAQRGARMDVAEASLAGGQVYELRTVPAGQGRWLTLLRNITERKRIERMSREFVAMVSHELRTPLTVIKGTLDLLDTPDDTPLSPEYADLVTCARENAEHLIVLLNDLLDSQKIDAGQFAIHPQPVECEAVLFKAMRFTMAFADRHQVRLLLEGSPPEVMLMADGGRLVQALTNLITNAIKFSPAGGVVTVRAEQQGPVLRLAVEDHGPGIPEAFQPRIFQKFAQADSSSTRARGGTGLGLSITKAIVEMHGGRVGFTTEAGQGSIFFLEVPLAEA